MNFNIESPSLDQGYAGVSRSYGEKIDATFKHLFSLINYEDESEGVNAQTIGQASRISRITDSESPPAHRLETKKNSPTRKQTNWNDDYSNLTINSKYLVQKIINIFGQILLGKKNQENPTSSDEEMILTLKTDELVWKSMGEETKESLDFNMNELFKVANSLLKERILVTKQAYYQRITFWATLIIGVVGKAVALTYVSKLCLIASAVTLVFMCVYYGKTYYQLRDAEDDYRSNLILAFKQYKQGVA